MAIITEGELMKRAPPSRNKSSGAQEVDGEAQAFLFNVLMARARLRDRHQARLNELPQTKNGQIVNGNAWNGKTRNRFFSQPSPSSPSKAPSSKEPELIAKHGYPVETHTVTTSDGYILDIHRIPHGSSGTGKGPRIPVLIQHGLLCSSADWLVSGPGKALGFILADEGYDVWLGNVRGNRYGRRHRTLSPQDDAFWSFSWHEMGKFDLPAILDAMTERTGQEKLHYVGHSMGTVMFWVLSDQRPEYSCRFLSMHGMGPVARVDHMASPIRYMAPFVDQVQWTWKLIGRHEFLPHELWMKMEKYLSWVCLGNSICKNALFLLCGYDSHQLSQVRNVLMARARLRDRHQARLNELPQTKNEQIVNGNAWNGETRNRFFSQPSPSSPSKAPSSKEVGVEMAEIR
ncbi:unnamed protein product [Darwinula stevensoni]|uniref:Partial AB-hydrolase lipase domain-containing protein n=1 Tax=Darwinula stevensoni TaxID=69355 RepID=A0A7R9FSD8_9CRUS|nr:unnamed protein product [Darwinula stevensoni]CAG0903536.1 unnamed protein product [Darwinula stevensoni]